MLPVEIAVNLAKRAVLAGLGCALAAFLAAAPAQAQKPPTDAQVVAICLKKAEGAGDFGASCVGVAADPCIANAMKQKTYWDDSKACAARELTIWAELMQKTLARIDKAADKTIKAAVTEAQRSFLASRDKLCPVFDGLDPGMVPGGANYCRLQETARRTLALQRLAAALSPH